MIPAREIDFRSLKLLMERSTGGSPLKKERAISKIAKAFKRGCLVIPPNETEAQKWWRCEARFMLGDYSDWEGWEYRDEWAATLWHNKPYPIPPWNGLKTKKLYIIGEQGIGDEVFFASCLPEAISRSDECILECMPRLQTIFERSFGIKTVSSNMQGEKRLKQDLPAGTTAWMSLADLPRMWRLDLKHFPGKPYLTADPKQIERFAQHKGRTGVSWRGAQGQIPELTKLGISLQYDRAWDEEVEEIDLDLRNDIEGVLGLLANLEKVVSVSTSVAHFSAAMGVPTEVIIADPLTARRGNIFPFKWICQKTPGRTPWYGSARVYKDYNHYRTRALS